MIRIIRKILGTSLALLALYPLSLSAQESKDVSIPSKWTSSFFTIEFSGFAVKTDAQNKAFPGETIYINSEGAGDIALTCFMKKLRTTIEIKPTDFESIVVGNTTSQRGRIRDVSFFIADKRISSRNCTHVPKINVVLSNKRSDAIRLYNAAIRGDSVQAKISGAPKVELNLRKPNSAFADFGSECGIGKKR